MSKLDEAITIGRLSANKADYYVTLTQDLLIAISVALDFLRNGRTQDARETLELAHVAAGQYITKFAAPDMTEAVMRAIAQHREQAGAAPYDGWEAIHGKEIAIRMRKQLFEEAEAVLRVLGVQHEPA